MVGRWAGQVGSCAMVGEGGSGTRGIEGTLEMRQRGKGRVQGGGDRNGATGDESSGRDASSYSLALTLLLPFSVFLQPTPFFSLYFALTLSPSLLCFSLYPFRFNCSILSLSVLISSLYNFISTRSFVFLSPFLSFSLFRSPLFLSLHRLFVSSSPTFASPLFYFSSIHISPMNSFFFLRICAVSTNFVSPLPLFFARFFLSFFLRRSSLPFIYYFYRSFSLGTILSTISFLFSFPAPPLLLTIPSVFFIPFLSLSLSFHLPVEHIISLLFPAFVRTRVSLSLSRIFIFIFRFSRGYSSSLFHSKRSPCSFLIHCRECAEREKRLWGERGGYVPHRIQGVGERLATEYTRSQFYHSSLYSSNLFLSISFYLFLTHSLILTLILTLTLYVILFLSLSLSLSLSIPRCVTLPLALHPAEPRELWIRRGRMLCAPSDWRAATPHELFGNLIVS